MQGVWFTGLMSDRQKPPISQRDSRKRCNRMRLCEIQHFPACLTCRVYAACRQ